MTQAPRSATLTTDRLILRPIGPQDCARGMGFLTSERSHYIGGPYSAHDAWIHFGHLIGHWALRGFGPFAFCLKGSDEVLGETGPFFPEGWCEHELGWTIWSKADEGKGYAYEAAQAARTHAFETLGWDTAVSYIGPDNTRSIALAERLGAQRDDNARIPDLPDWDGTLVYRHSPEARP